MKHANRFFVNRHRLLALLMILTVVLVLVVLASMVKGMGYYLISLAVLLGIGVGVVLLLVRVVKRLPGGHEISDWWQQGVRQNGSRTAQLVVNVTERYKIGLSSDS
jgi:hypothetical protein